MKFSDFVSTLDDQRIVDAIARAEKSTSGEVRVYISHKDHDNPVAAAEKRFKKLGMHKTRERNAVLIYLVPHSRNFAVIGDAGIHEKCGSPFWEEVTAQMSADLRSGHPTQAIVNAVEKIGNLLAVHFPCRPDDRNELSNKVERD
jgi:uncharacterized membrane protein